MRLWHQELIPYLPRQQLLGQHRECCVLRGNGWNKRHIVIDYIFRYTHFHLFQYHKKVMAEMSRRNYKADILWLNPKYRGKKCNPIIELCEYKIDTTIIYKEHNDKYLKECIENLSAKFQKDTNKYNTQELKNFNQFILKL